MRELLTPANSLLVEAALLIFGIQVVVYSFLLAQTEHFYDLTGGITYLSTMAFMAIATKKSLAVGTLVLWC